MSDIMIFSGHKDSSVCIWCTRKKQIIHEFKDIHDDSITSVTACPDGQTILTNSLDNTLKLIDIRMMKVLSTF
jgi:WD40 repeat protein